ncbi:hypothetical protein JOM56_004368 [Amanita muscaria]
MPSPVTWYRITNVVAALGFLVAKYTQINGTKVNTVDFAEGVFTAVVLYVIGWWEQTPGLQWYFRPDWQAQRGVMISCVAKLKDLIPKVISICANELISALLLILQFPGILAMTGFFRYRGYYFLNYEIIYFSVAASIWVPFEWTVFYALYRTRRPLTCFERIFFGITAVQLLFVGAYVATIPIITGGIHKNPLWLYVARVLTCLVFSLWASSFAMRGRTTWSSPTRSRVVVWIRTPPPPWLASTTLDHP